MMTERQIFCSNLLTAMIRSPASGVDQILADVRKYLPKDLTDQTFARYDQNGSLVSYDTAPIEQKGIATHQYNRAFNMYFKARKTKK